MKKEEVEREKVRGKGWRKNIGEKGRKGEEVTERNSYSRYNGLEKIFLPRNGFDEIENVI